MYMYKGWIEEKMTEDMKNRLWSINIQ